MKKRYFIYICVTAFLIGFCAGLAKAQEPDIDYSFEIIADIDYAGLNSYTASGSAVNTSTNEWTDTVTASGQDWDVTIEYWNTNEYYVDIRRNPWTSPYCWIKFHTTDNMSTWTASDWQNYPNADPVDGTSSTFMSTEGGTEPPPDPGTYPAFDETATYYVYVVNLDEITDKIDETNIKLTGIGSTLDDIENNTWTTYQELFAMHTDINTALFNVETGILDTNVLLNDIITELNAQSLDMGNIDAKLSTINTNINNNFTSLEQHLTDLLTNTDILEEPGPADSFTDHDELVIDLNTIEHGNTFKSTAETEAGALKTDIPLPSKSYELPRLSVPFKFKTSSNDPNEIFTRSHNGVYYGTTWTKGQFEIFDFSTNEISTSIFDDNIKPSSEALNYFGQNPGYYFTTTLTWITRGTIIIALFLGIFDLLKWTIGK